MNYIRHLNAFFSFVKSDNRLTASHVSLYLALFQYWNFNRFQNPFPIYRTDILQLCKIGSKNTYHKCLKELHHFKYFIYHPATSKYKPVKISMIRLDKQVPGDPKQLDLFLPFEEAGGGSSPNTGTQHVPILTGTGTDFDTAQVPNSGHLIKPNNKQQNSVAKTPTEIFMRKKKLNDTAKELGHVSKSIPVCSEVEAFFKANNYPEEEAKKFFHYNNGKNWMLTDKLPILNWKSIAHKWMLSPKRTAPQQPEPAKEIQYLQEIFLEGKKIFHHITVEHFHQLKLELSDEIMQQAWKERINQVSGTNQHSLDQLWQAYLTGDHKNELVKRDNHNLFTLAKRLAVFNHFNNLKNQSQ